MLPYTIIVGLGITVYKLWQIKWKVLLGLALLGLLYIGTWPIRNPLVRKEPYLIYTDDPSEMLMMWQLDRPFEHGCTLNWGQDPTNLTNSITIKVPGQDQIFNEYLKNLKPETHYHYTVQIDDETFTGSFLTAPHENAKSAKLIIYGDTRRHYADHDDVCASIMREIDRDPNYASLIVFTGDWVQDGREESDWQNEQFNRHMEAMVGLKAIAPYMGCIGNHEYKGKLYAKYFPFDYAGHPFYLDITHGPMHLFIIDQYRQDYSPGSSQYYWLENAIASSGKPWKAIILHAPGYSANGNHVDMKEVQDYIQPLCEKYNIPLVFSAHNHYYCKARVNGVLHITTGGGGAPLYTPVPDYSPYIEKTVKTHHFCKINIQGDQLTLTAVDKQGKVIDTFTLNR